MIHVILFPDSGGFQASILSVITYMNEGGSMLSNDAQCASVTATNLIKITKYQYVEFIPNTLYIVVEDIVYFLL